MQDAQITLKAQEVGLAPGLLYEAVIDLAADNMLTASTINKAAAILLNDLALPKYFFNIIHQNALSKLLKAIALSMQEGKDGEVILQGQVRPVDLDLGEAGLLQVLISTREARTITEHKVESEISGHRRAYYFNPDNGYATCLLRPETVADFSKDDFKKSRFLFSLAGDYIATPEPTRLRYEEFLNKDSGMAEQLIELYNLPETGETRIMFNSDFERPQLPVLRKLFEEYGCAVTRALVVTYTVAVRIDVTGARARTLCVADAVAVRIDEVDACSVSLGPCITVSVCCKCNTGACERHGEKCGAGECCDLRFLVHDNS